MSRRRLSEEERALWQGVIRSIVPLHKSASPETGAAAPAKAGPKGHDTGAASNPAATASMKAPAPNKRNSPPPLAPLGRRLRQRIARGVHTIDGQLDLHGMTQAQAHAALFRFLRITQERGGRTVLVITGKGATAGERGVLKREVPRWLRLPEFRGMIVGFETASAAHGGEGALYVTVRKLRQD